VGGSIGRKRYALHEDILPEQQPKADQLRRNISQNPQEIKKGKPIEMNLPN
jgi:hypothetical protein